MSVIAYLVNQFPTPVEPYVADEIRELRRRGVQVVSSSARQADLFLTDSLRPLADETVYLQPLGIVKMLKAAWLCLIRIPLLFDLYERVIVLGTESPARRLKALAHTWLGAYYALLIENRGVEHIHVHHGYFASWIAMVAARLHGISFSITLHGSDVLLHPEYLDTKLLNCEFCTTISDFNRSHILERYPGIDSEKIVTRRMGVNPNCQTDFAPYSYRRDDKIILLAVGRLHRIKDHAFLVRACRKLKDKGTRSLCLIAGEGPERPALEKLISQLELQAEVRLLGHLSPEQLDACYMECDLVVLTSRSEGIPLVLMEAMVRGKAVLAPAITGVPELVIDGRTGLLYRSGSLPDFVGQVAAFANSRSSMESIRQAGLQHVLSFFNREKNLPAFIDLLLSHVGGSMERDANENSLLQQI